ncbi:hypothetical protein SAMN05216436_103147 [bacterium A37T11]|nr:hypothetical protein SAMN05216436_103147 [bacterium A37T11]
MVPQIYLAELGVKEASGHNDGPRVEEYLRYTKLGPGHNWCASFVCWTLGKAGVDNPRNPWCPALFPDKRVVWCRGDAMSHISRADIFGIYFPSLKRIGHVGFIDTRTDDYIITVEGNADNAVIRKRRSVHSIYKVANWINK